jgi:hypothetical protein
MKMAEQKTKVERAPGTVVTWQEKVKELPQITANEQLVKQSWEGVDGLAYMYIWQMLLSF